MAGENTTIARPYAEAVFARAQESDKLELWTEMLEFLASVAEDGTMSAVFADPKFDRESLTRLMLEVGGGRLNDEGQNLVKLLVQNGRLQVLSEIARVFEQLKAESQKQLAVTVRSAFTLMADQERQIAEVLKVKLGCDISITAEMDPELIGGIHIRAGDMVIDGSVSGQLQQLANELGI